MAKKKTVNEDEILEQNEIPEEVVEAEEVVAEAEETEGPVECKVLHRLLVDNTISITGFLEIGNIVTLPYDLAISLARRGLVDLDV